MTAPPASSLRSRFLLGLDSSAPTAPAPSPGHHHPPAPARTATLHSTSAGPWWPKWGAVFLWFRSPAPLTPTCIPPGLLTKLTSHLAAPHACCVPAPWVVGALLTGLLV